MTDEAFCALYEAHASRLWAYVARASGNAAVADDIVQEAFMRAFEAKRLREADMEHRRRYLYKIAANLIRRRYRRAAEVELTEGLELSGSSGTEESVAVAQALERLSQVERQTLWLAHVEGWSLGEIASTLGYREGSLRHVAVRARRRFLQALRGELK
jgi:RNA polymerase sigma-70 factor (ECF subfamily)